MCKLIKTIFTGKKDSFSCLAGYTICYTVSIQDYSPPTVAGFFFCDNGRPDRATIDAKNSIMVRSLCYGEIARAETWQVAPFSHLG